VYSTDEDARQAMLADGGKIKEVKVKLLLSSRAEMQKVIEMARQQTLALQNFMQIPPQQPPLPPTIPQPPPTPQHPTPPHMLGATPVSVLGHLHMQQTHSPGPQPHHMLAGANIPHLPQHAAQQSPQHVTPPPQQPQQPAQQQPLQPAAPSSTNTSDKKDGDSSSSRKDKRNRSRSRSRDNSRRRSRDKDRDRYRRRGGRSRSRSRDRRRRDRSRSRDRGRDRRGKSDKDSKDNKDKDQKQNGASDVVVVGQFGGRGGNGNKNAGGGSSSSAEARQRPQQKVQPQPAVTNGNLQEPISGGGGVGAPGWNSNMPVSDIMLPTQERERAIVNPMIPPNANMMGLPSRIPGNFPPNPDIRGGGFPFPGAQDQQAWMLSRQQGMPPQQGPQPPPMSRFEEGHPQGRGGFRGPPARPRPSRFEPMDGHGGPPEYPHGDVRDGPFPPARGRDRPPFDDNYRGGPPRPPFRDNARAPRTIPHTCVEIRNVPVATAYRDVREFFQGMHVLNIKLINDEEGRRTGIAHVKFMNLESKEAALTMNGALLHGTPVEVLHLDDNIYDEATDSYQPSSECTIVALHGLPPYANEQDVRRLFPGARLINIVMTRSKNPQAPQVYVQFSTMQEGRRALAASGKLTVDGKDIFVERSTLETLMNTKKMIMEMVPDAHDVVSEIKEKPTPPRQESKVIVSDCVHLQGLSQNSNDREIVDFFSDIGLVPARIHLMLDSNNTPSGDAFCEFTNCAEATRALAKNGNILGSKDISVRAVTRNEMNQALGILEQKLNDEQAMLAARPMPPMGRNGPIPPEHMRGGPGPMVGPPMRGPPMHPAEFMGRGGRHYGDMRGGPHMRGHRGMHHGGPPMMGRPAPQAPSHHHPHKPEGPTVDNFGNPGCVIEMQNVPYKAEIDEIIEYFDGFDVARANVIRRYNDSGMPTGDARVSLQTPSEAQRAIQELKFKKMRDRQIYMCII
jgi:RNA recognition motif-containing protein